MRNNVGMRVDLGAAGRAGAVLRRALVLCGFLALASWAWAGAALGTVPGTNGPIVFSVYGKIHTIHPDGSGLTPVVREEEEYKYDFFPSWAPEGLRIATTGKMREPDGYWTVSGLHVFAPDGSNFERLPIAGYIEDPAWSPDGAHILFIRDGELLSTTPDGALPTPVVSNAWTPAWSPDGQRIAFVRPVGQEEETDLYTVSASGGAPQKLLDLPGRVMSPSWSPDGSTIVFDFRKREPREDPAPWELPYTYSGPNIYAVSATGGEPVQLTESGTDQDAVWSPDGSMIVFQSDRASFTSSGGPNLYLMNADGSGEHQLADVSCLQCGPDWASLPPHSQPVPAAPETQGAELRRQQKFSRLSLTRTRFARPTRVWLRFQAAVGEKVSFTIRRAVPPARAPSCRRKPGTCVWVRRDERQARDGFNRIPLSGLLGTEPAPGRYWLQLASSSNGARAGLAFRVTPPRKR
jgi:Tol biopolymer transport system component